MSKTCALRNIISIFFSIYPHWHFYKIDIPLTLKSSPNWAFTDLICDVVFCPSEGIKWHWICRSARCEIRDYFELGMKQTPKKTEGIRQQEPVLNQFCTGYIYIYSYTSFDFNKFANRWQETSLCIYYSLIFTIAYKLKSEG